MFLHAVAHGLYVVGPGHAQQRGKVHQQLAVATQHIELADVASEHGFVLFGLQRIFGQQGRTIIAKALLHLRLAVELE